MEIDDNIDPLEVSRRIQIASQRVIDEIDGGSVVIPFVSDATLLRRILGNIVKNALEASPTGDIVTLGVNSSEAGLNFWVHNSAVIPAEYQQRIFQRDFSTKGPGRGLGTYMYEASRLLSFW